MKTLKLSIRLLAAAAVISTIGCCTAPPEVPYVADSVRKSLDQAGYRDVTASQDRKNGVLTLGGHVTAEADKAQAAVIAKSIAGNQVVANEIAVLPIGDEKVTKEMIAELDKGIIANLKAAFIQTRFPAAVKRPPGSQRIAG